MKKVSLSVKNVKQKRISSFFIKPTPEVDLNVKEVLKEKSNGNCVGTLKIESFESPNQPAKRKRVASPTKKSPSKSKQKLGSPLKRELFEVGDAFFDDFDFDSKSKGNLNIEKLERFEVISIETLQNGDMKLNVKGVNYCDNAGDCIVKSPWTGCMLKVGDIISLKGIKTDEGWVVDWKGLMVCNADHLISGTTIVGSLYCTRKTILSNIFEELGEREAKHMVLGSVVHELLQEALRKKYRNMEDIEKLYKAKIESKDFVLQMFLEKMNFDETLSSISSYLPQIYEFINQYVTYGKPRITECKTENWNGEIVNVKDIEENIWSPTLGIKGKVDATVQVKAKKNTKVMPLELKTGKVSFSLEHRGQVILYCMLLRELGEFVDSGLLLYLKGGGGIKEIQAAEKEIRDLTLLRNGLSRWMHLVEEVEESDPIAPPQLPLPINRKSCQSCGHLIACSSALRMNGVEKLEKSNILRQLVPEVTSHLTDAHLKYIFHLVGLQSLENSSTKSSVARIWSIPPEKREENGWCLTNMKVETSSFVKGGKFEVVFKKSDSSPISEIFEPGQTIVVSNQKQVAISIGFAKSVGASTITVLLEKCMKSGEGPLQLDSYESNTLTKATRANIGLLLDNSPRAQSLRESIIDMKVPPFLPKLSSKVKKIGQEIFNKLNREQVRAVLQALSAERYILIKGMPGTGKTTTMRALIELLVKLGNRVLVTSLTHSAVDNILSGMVGKVSILRLGSERRIHPSLKKFSEEALVGKLTSVTVDGLEKIFKSKQVVGVTCHGSGHAWLQRQEFDVCLVDEATQVSQPNVLRPLLLAKKFILIGDPKQLPPLIINEKAKELGLGESLFKKLDRPAVTSVLSQQYRMNQSITDLANNFSYDGQLKCGSEQVANATLHYATKIEEDCPRWKNKILSDKLEDSAVVVNVESTNSRTNINEAEANVILDIVNDLLKLGISGDSIGVIATYRDQVNLLKNLLGPVEVNTVDQYQGRDKEIIVYSTTRTKKHSDNDITGDTNRLTVAITRAKRKFIIVCNVELMKSYSNFAKLFKFIPNENFVDYTAK